MYARCATIVILLSCTFAFADEDTELQETITAALISATGDEDENVRLAAYVALKDQPRTDATSEVFRRGLNDDSKRVQLVALTKLVEEEGATEENLDRLIAAIGDPHISNEAIRLLIELARYLVRVG